MKAMSDPRYLVPLPRLLVLTDMEIQNRWDHLAIARAAFVGGADGVQLRDKRSAPTEREGIARDLLSLAREFGPGHHLFINDDPALARRVDAAGVHVGPDDPSPEEARRIVGEGKWVGFSAGTPDEARWAERIGADYLGVGAVFGSQTKGDAGAPIGLEGLAAVSAATRLPVIAIGSVTAERVAELIDCGAHGIAVISAVCLAAEPQAATRRLADELSHALSARGESWP
jgi:thiamine-phosphate pyrophosphorylase